MVSIMRTFNFSFICLFLVLTISCQTTKNIEGVYTSKKGSNRFEFFSDSTFIFHSTLFPRSSFVDKYSEGIWKRFDRNSIVLFSKIADNIIPVKTKKREFDKTNILEICENVIIIQVPKKRVDLEYTDRDYYVIPYVNGSNYLDLHPELSDEPISIGLRELIGLENDKNDKNIIHISPKKRGSYCFLSTDPIDEIYFEIIKQPERIEKRSFYKLRTININHPVQLGESLVIDIILNDSLFSYRIFDNTKIKFKGDRLIFEDSEDNNKKKDLYLEKK